MGELFGKQRFYNYKSVIFLVHMASRCEIMGKYMLPLFRSYVAKELLGAHNLTQMEAAHKLQTTQAAISQYVNSKRAIRRTETIDSTLPKIQAFAANAAERLAKGETNWREVTTKFCIFCSTLFEDGVHDLEDYAI